MTDETAPILRLTNAWKVFGHVIALGGVEVSATPGEILAIVGDNGAGKSTLVKVIAGVYRLDDGDYEFNGQNIARSDPRLLQQLGVSTVFQDLALVETLDVATNMYLNMPKTRLGFLADRSAMYEGAADTLASLRVRLPSVRVPIGELSGGQRQSVAIARAVLRGSPVILLDEPTAALGVRETEMVGNILRELREQGKAVVLVSHDMEFVFRHADVIQVMRLGRVQGVRRTTATNRSEIVSMITGLLSDSSSSDQVEATGQ